MLVLEKRTKEELKVMLENIPVLTQKWKCYERTPPNEFSLDLARRVLSRTSSLFDNFLPNAIVAIHEGGVKIVFSSSNKYADIEICNDGEITVGYIDEIADSIGLWDFDSIESTLNKIKDFISTN